MPTLIKDNAADAADAVIVTATKAPSATSQKATTSKTTATTKTAKTSKTTKKAATKKAAPKPEPTLPDAYTLRDRARLRAHALSGLPLRLDLDSSAVCEAVWHPWAQTLAVRYADGSRYRYIGVGTAAVRGLIAAPSKGRYINNNVRSLLPYQRLA